MSDLPPIALVEEAAKKLGGLCNEVVFLGGAIVPLLIEEEGGQPPRATKDVDVAIEMTGQYIDQVKLDKRLIDLGFNNDPNGPVCRYIHGVTVLDVILVSTEESGDANNWYPLAIETAEPHTLDNGIDIKVIAPECFLGTKMMAFRAPDRLNKNDTFLSRDFGDSIRVIDGRPDIAREVLQAREDLCAYLQEQWRDVLSENYIEEAIEQHVDPGRQKAVIERIRAFLP